MLPFSRPFLMQAVDDERVCVTVIRLGVTLCPMRIIIPEGVMTVRDFACVRRGPHRHGNDKSCGGQRSQN